MPICHIAVLASQRQWYARRSAERAGASGDEPGAHAGRVGQAALRAVACGDPTPAG